MRPVDADALTEELKRWLALPNRDNVARDVVLHLIAVINNAPTVEERPQGEWNYIQAGMAVCPFCGARPHKDYKNFCSNCGAFMKDMQDPDTEYRKKWGILS